MVGRNAAIDNLKDLEDALKSEIPPTRFGQDGRDYVIDRINELFLFAEMAIGDIYDKRMYLSDGLSGVPRFGTSSDYRDALTVIGFCIRKAREEINHDSIG